MIAKNENKSAEPKPYEGPRPTMSPGTRTFLWVFSIVMVLTAGTAFMFKLIEFFYTATTVGKEAMGSFLIPLSTYLIVAAGFGCLFFWAYMTGQFKDVEGPKYRMLKMQDEFDAMEKS